MVGENITTTNNYILFSSASSIIHYEYSSQSSPTSPPSTTSSEYSTQTHGKFLHQQGQTHWAVSNPNDGLHWLHNTISTD